MSDEMDPPRLSRGADSDAERRLAALVSASQADVGSKEQVAALEARLLPLIGPPGVPGAPAAKAAGAGKAATLGGAGVAKLAAAGAVVAAASAIYLGTHGSHGSRTTAIAPSVSAQQVAPALHTEEPPATAAPVESPPAESAPAPEVVGSAPAAPTAVSHERAPSESELIGQAQAALSGNPARALALCDQHRRQYPRGILVQEREVLAIEALQRLGRHSQAVARGEHFLKAFPGSAHQSKIAAIVGSR